MSLQAIIQKIKTDSEIETGEILAEAERRIAGTVQETKAKIDDIKLNFLASLEKQQIQREVVVTSLEKQKVSMETQTTKRHLLDEVYTQALDELLALDSNEYVSLLTNKYKKLIPEGTKVVSILAPENRQVETAEISKALGFVAPIVASQKLKGGCILVGDNFEFDLSIERLFIEDRSKSEIEIAQMLFLLK